MNLHHMKNMLIIMQTEKCCIKMNPSFTEIGIHKTRPEDLLRHTERFVPHISIIRMNKKRKASCHVRKNKYS